MASTKTSLCILILYFISVQQVLSAEQPERKRSTPGTQDAEQPMARVRVPDVPWEGPSILTYLIYLYCITTFSVFVYTQKLYSKEKFVPHPLPMPLLMSTLPVIPFVIFQLCLVFFMHVKWFSFSGKILNYFWILWMPYRCYFPVTEEMMDYSKGRGPSESRKTLKLMVSILMDLLLMVGLIILMIKFATARTVLISATLIAACSICWVLLTKEKRIVVVRNVKKGSSYLLSLMIILCPLEYIYGNMSILEIGYSYSSILLLFSQLWIIKMGAGKVAN